MARTITSSNRLNPQLGARNALFTFRLTLSPSSDERRTAPEAFATGDLSEFDWYGDDLVGGRIESLVTFLPDESGVPGPATLLLLLPGVALLRRR